MTLTDLSLVCKKEVQFIETFHLSCVAPCLSHYKKHLIVFYISDWIIDSGWDIYVQFLLVWANINFKKLSF